MNAAEGWNVKTLSELLDLTIDYRGRTPKKLGMEWGGGDIPALSANNVEMGRINFSKECYFGSDELYRKWMVRGDPRIGDIVLTTEAPLGNVARIPDGQRYILSQRTILLRSNEAELCNGYLFHYLSSEPFQRLMRQHSSGTTATGIQRAKFEMLPIRFPVSVIEQTKISEILSKIDRVIDQTEALIAKQQHIKAGLMQDLLTRGIDKHGNLRSEHTHQFKDSSLGRIPVEWEVKTLKNLSRGGAQNGFFKKPERVGSGYKLINVSDIYQSFGIDTNSESVERVNAESNDLLKYVVMEGDLFFTRSSLVLEGIAHCNIIQTIYEPTLFECHVIRMRPDRAKIVPEFLALECQTRLSRRFFMSRAKHVTMATISQPELEELNVPMPVSLEEQQVIVNSILSNDQEIRRSEGQRSKLRRIKTALMQGLLTGKKSVMSLLQYTEAAIS